MQDRRGLADVRATQVARTYEEVVHGAEVTDTSAGDVRASGLIRDLLRERGCAEPSRVSVDLISVRGPDDIRLIEVKGRGGAGPRTVPERELDTLRAGGGMAWLYAVDNVTQPQPTRLVLVQDPGSLPWIETSPAARAPGSFRGVRHEAVFTVSSEAVAAAGELIDISELPLPTWAGHSRD